MQFFGLEGAMKMILGPFCFGIIYMLYIYIQHRSSSQKLLATPYLFVFLAFV